MLLRGDGESRFGAWKYEPVETKLAKTTRGATLIQLCLYADLLAEVQGASPEILRVVVDVHAFEADQAGRRFRLVKRARLA